VDPITVLQVGRRTVAAAPRGVRAFLRWWWRQRPTGKFVSMAAVEIALYLGLTQIGVGAEQSNQLVGSLGALWFVVFVFAVALG
jgi:hypothetical protein